MTAVAWDGKTLAADRRATDEYGRISKTLSSKIGRRNGCLWGVTGKQSLSREMLEWWDHGAVPSDFPNAARESKSTLIIVNPNARVDVYTDGPYPAKDEQNSWGCASELTWMAMRCGKTAEEAVLLTAEKSCYVGDGVDTLELE